MYRTGVQSLIEQLANNRPHSAPPAVTQNFAAFGFEEVDGRKASIFLVT